MKGSVIYLDKDQLKLINLIDEWLRDEMMETTTPLMDVDTIRAARTFLVHLHEKGWYREGGDEQDLLQKLRNEWIKDGGKWKS
jgi:hypothetical protein